MSTESFVMMPSQVTIWLQLFVRITQLNWLTLMTVRNGEGDDGNDARYHYLK